jgi:hypothetical protein
VTETAGRAMEYGNQVATQVAGAVLQWAGQPEPAAFDALMEALFEFGDTVQRSLTQQDPPRRTIACRAGCSHCCRGLYVQVSPLEVVQLARALRRQKSAAEFAAVRERITAAAAAVAGSGPNARPLLAEACPLLEAGRCGAYADRPFACRGANSADVTACEAVTAGKNAAVPMYVHQRVTWAAVLSGAAAGLQGARPGKTAVVELVAALALALEHDDPLAAWQSGTLDFSPAASDETA